ncbi:hypothetical protein niasHS_017436 [Heterodera schachtii]|uniref:GRIP domain-containing protein n=1 Tax=Heterodera schachtii TaxID=97005 RepID=A0ABD2I0F8_HETSC
MECSNCSLLRRDFEEQKIQIVRYEAKIKDLVNAYKSLTTEKQSLEVALSLLSAAGEDNSEKSELGKSNGEETGEIAQGTEKREGDELSVAEQIEALKQAISTLTLVNKRKEMEFKKDRRSLLETRDEFQNRCSDLEQQLKLLKQQNRSQHTKQLRADLADSKEAFEKAMTEHGMVLAELQQQYTKEKKHGELLEKQVTEMSQRLAEKDAQIKQTEGRLKQIGNLEKETEMLRKKAQLTPTVRVIKDELANVKSSSDKELNVCRSRNAIQQAQLREKECRIGQLEQKVRELSERCAEAERRSIELEAKMADKTEQTKTELSEAIVENVTVAKRFRAFDRELLQQKSDVDPIAVLCSEPFSLDLQKSDNGEGKSDPSECPREFSPSTPVPSFCSKSESSVSLNILQNADTDCEIPHIMANEGNLCDFCVTSRKELDYFKSLLGHLQRKLATLEESHERTKKQHDGAADLLRQRIVELENSKQRSFVQLTAESRQRVIELEDELAKQRTRIAEVIAEKDREIELTKKLVTSSGHFGASDCESVPALPMDPQPNGASVSASARMKWNQTRATHSKNHTSVANSIDELNTGQDCADGGRERRSSVGENGNDGTTPPQTDFSASFRSVYARRLSHSSVFSGVNSTPTTEKAPIVAGTAARNIFYEQELSKREQEIGELRNVIRLLELKVRDIEQAMLMKDVQYLQIIETLKEEIRVLEGRLSLASSQTNMAYLRNIFVQFVGQGSISGRRHILKAIGAVLQLTPAEMRRVDRWAY